MSNLTFLIIIISAIIILSIILIVLIFAFERNKNHKCEKDCCRSGGRKHHHHCNSERNYKILNFILWCIIILISIIFVICIIWLIYLVFRKCEKKKDICGNEILDCGNDSESEVDVCDVTNNCSSLNYFSPCPPSTQRSVITRPMRNNSCGMIYNCDEDYVIKGKIEE